MDTWRSLTDLLILLIDGTPLPMPQSDRFSWSFTYNGKKRSGSAPVIVAYLLLALVIVLCCVPCATPLFDWAW